MSIKMYNVILIVIVILIQFSQNAELATKMKSDSKLNSTKVEGKTVPLLKSLEERTFKLAEKFIIPMLMGGLLKVAAVIPIIAVVSTFIGTISLIGSKISLLISLILGVRAILSLIPSEPKEPQSFSYEDLHDLHQILSKHPDKNHWDAHSNGDDDPHGYYHSPYPVMYYPEAYMHTTAPDAHFKDHEVADHVKVAGAHAISRLDNGILRRDGHVGKMKVLAATEMAAKANAILSQQTLEYPNGKVGVKITKTVVKHSG